MENIDMSIYVVPAVAVAVYVVCSIIHNIDKIDNKYIPLIAGILGIAFSAWMNGGFSFDIFLQGLVSGFGATGANQVIKQLFTNGE